MLNFALLINKVITLEDFLIQRMWPKGLCIRFFSSDFTLVEDVHTQHCCRLLFDKVKTFRLIYVGTTTCSTYLIMITEEDGITYSFVVGSCGVIETPPPSCSSLPL